MTRATQPYSLLALAAVIAIAIATLILAPEITSAGGNGGGSGKLDPADFSTTIDNPLFPLSNLETKVFEGEETDPDTGEVVTASLVSTVLPRSAHIAGIDVLVLEESAYEDGELIERALDYFAQHKDGTVYYFGEDVDNYVDGKVADHDGSWRAGRDGAVQGIIMPAHPFLNQIFNQENAPGVAEDQSKVLALNESVSTPAGNFTSCLKAEDTSPLDPGLADLKWYCPGVGLVRDEGGPDSFIELVSYELNEN